MLMKRKLFVLLSSHFNGLLVLLILLIGVAGAIYLRLTSKQAAPAAAGIDFTPAFAIIQLNDVYRIDAVENGKLGGLSRVASLVKQTQQANKNVFIFHAGDFLSPSLESEYFGGHQMVAALNYLSKLAHLYVVPGNHEFDFKKASAFDNAMRSSEFTWLSSNINFEAKGDLTKLERFPERNKVVTMGGMKVGIFALTISGNYKSEDIGWPAVASKYPEVAKKEISELEQQGADVIVGLTHLEVDDDKKVAALRSEHPKFMWIAGGHEHTAQKYDLDEKSALITKGDSNARSIWRVYFGMKNGKLTVHPEKINVNESIQIDGAYKTKIEDYYHAELKQRIPQLDEVIGTTTACLDGREETIRNQESNLGNYIVDQMRLAFPGVAIDAAILGSGTIRIDDRICNDIRVAHLLRTIGFPTRITYISISGKDLKRTLEHAITRKYGNGRFLQVSGVRFEFDRSKNDENRVSNIWIKKKDRWEALSENNASKMYTVALPEFIFCGGDDYSFKGSKVMNQTAECKNNHLAEAFLGPDLRHILIDAVSRAQLKGQPIAVPYEMRILDKTPLGSNNPQ